MKLKDGFVVKNIVGEYLLSPIGDNCKNFSSMVVLNETSAFIIGLLQNDISFDDLLCKLISEYDCNPSILKNDLIEFLGILKTNDMLIE